MILKVLSTSREELCYFPDFIRRRRPRIRVHREGRKVYQMPLDKPCQTCCKGEVSVVYLIGGQVCQEVSWLIFIISRRTYVKLFCRQEDTYVFLVDM